MITRYAGATVAAASVTFGLFFLMQYLIDSDLRGEQETIRSAPIELARPERESDVQTKRRLPRQAAAEQPPPPPTLQMDRSTRPRVDVGSVPVSFDPAVDLGGGPGLGASDADVTPVVRVLPQYPMRAAERGVEGWVLLEFTVTKTGQVDDVNVVDADPPRIFNREAMRAIRKWKYNPKMVDGRPVAQPGIQAVISFELPDD